MGKWARILVISEVHIKLLHLILLQWYSSSVFEVVSKLLWDIFFFYLGHLEIILVFEENCVLSVFLHQLYFYRLAGLCPSLYFFPFDLSFYFFLLSFWLFNQNNRFECMWSHLFVQYSDKAISLSITLVFLILCTNITNN